MQPESLSTQRCVSCCGLHVSCLLLTLATGQEQGALLKKAPQPGVAHRPLSRLPLALAEPERGHAQSWLRDTLRGKGGAWNEGPGDQAPSSRKGNPEDLGRRPGRDYSCPPHPVTCCARLQQLCCLTPFSFPVPPAHSLLSSGPGKALGAHRRALYPCPVPCDPRWMKPSISHRKINT